MYLLKGDTSSYFCTMRLTLSSSLRPVSAELSLSPVPHPRESQVLVVGRPDDAEDELELVQVVRAGEQRAVVQHLGQDAPHGPQVHRLVVHLRVHHDLWKGADAMRLHTRNGKRFLISYYSSVTVTKSTYTLLVCPYYIRTPTASSVF